MESDFTTATPTAINKLIDENHVNKQFDAILKIVNQYKNIDNFTKDPEFLWRAARCYFDIADSHPNKDTQKSLLTTAHGLAKKALEQNSDVFGYCNKWVAITLSALSGHLSSKEKIQSSYLIKEHFDNAVSINPNDPITHYGLGRWCFAVASVSWIEKKLAQTLFAKPPHSTYEEALQHFLKAEELSEKKNEPLLRNRFYIADTYLQIGDKVNAKMWFDKTVMLNPVTETDKQLKSESIKKISKL